MAALDAVPWDRFESALPQHPVQGVPRALRRLARAGTVRPEEDVSTLDFCLAPGNGRVIPLATGVLPFLVALAEDPGTGQRLALVELLAELVRTAATAGPGLVDEEWPARWRRHRGAVRSLLADADPDVRRAALPLAYGVAPLLERWEAEADPAVRLPVLLALGEAAAAEAGPGPRARVRDVLAGVLRDGGPVMKVAAVISSAYLDPRAPLRRSDLLVEILSDAATRPEFEAAWYVPGVETAYSREDVVPWVTGLFDQDPRAAVSFVVRLVGAADRSGDAELCRAALGEAWRLLVLRPSAAPALLPVAGGLLADPDDAVRLKAAHLLAVLGPRAAAYADRLAALVDDPGTDDFDFTEGAVGDYARWALARIGDPRALPGLVERLYEPYREHYGRGYAMSDPRLPEIHEVLIPLREHADVLLPSLREVMRHHHAHHDGPGPLTSGFLRTLEAWGPDAAAALPEVLPLLDDTRSSILAIEVLAAMGPAAASAGPALSGSTIPDHPANHRKRAWAASRIGGDGATALRLIGEEAGKAEAPSCGLLADFGPAAAPYADRVRHVMETSEGWYRIEAAIALWSLTGEPEPSASVLEESVLPMADGDDSYGSFAEALRGLARIGRITPAARAALRTVQASDRRLSPYRDYRALLTDEHLRTAIDTALAVP